PPRPPLFPYTTLFRSQLRSVSPTSGCSILTTSAPMSANSRPQNGPAATLQISITLTPCSVVSCFNIVAYSSGRPNLLPRYPNCRSEEHTSELQSRENL